MAGFPRTNEGCRVYLESKKSGVPSYLLVLVENGQNGLGAYDCVGNTLTTSTRPDLSSSVVDPAYLSSLRRVTWEELPEEWQRAFLPYLEGQPEEIRGLHRVDG